MLKSLKSILALSLALVLTPTMALTAHADETNVTVVTTTEELVEAIENQKVNIELGADIQVTEKLNITYPVVIEGKGNTLSHANPQDGWQGQYVLHFYRTTATVKNITITDGDAAILVNGSTVTLEGNINVSGNEFGGIEVSRGLDVLEQPTLDIKNATLINTTENNSKPTIWVDPANAVKAEIVADPLTSKVIEVNGKTYYIVTPAEVNSEASLLAALAAEETVINITGDFTVDNKVAIEYPVRINGNGHTITHTNSTEGWQGAYILHFYRTEGIVKDITLTGGDAAILVNGSQVTLEGTVDVSGNEYGGIEVSKGTDVTEDPTLDFSNATLVNTSEKYTKPTIWTVGELTDPVVGPEGLQERQDKDGQTHYYMEPVYSPEDETNLENAKKAVNDLYQTPKRTVVKENITHRNIEAAFDLVDELMHLDEKAALMDSLTEVYHQLNALEAIDNLFVAPKHNSIKDTTNHIEIEKVVDLIEEVKNEDGVEFLTAKLKVAFDQVTAKEAVEALFKDETLIKDETTQDEITTATGLVEALEDNTDIKEALTAKVEEAQKQFTNNKTAKELVDGLFDDEGNIVEILTKGMIKEAKDAVELVIDPALKQDLEARITTAELQLSRRVYTITTSFPEYTGKEVVSITIDAPHNLFANIIVDGKVLEATDYTVTEGSTVITLTESYLKTLANKTYNVEINYVNDEVVDTTLKVNVASNPVVEETKEEPKTPNTGINNSLIMLMNILLLASFVFITLGKKSFVGKKY